MLETPSTVENLILEHLPPVFVEIAIAESGLQQFKDGKPLISKTSDVGILQINQVWWKTAEGMGLDIFNSVEDNIKMAKHIFKVQGIDAWVVCREIVKCE